MSVMVSEDSLVAKWNRLSPHERYYYMYDELSRFSSLGHMADDGITSDARQSAEIDQYSKWAAKSKFSELPSGLQRHALRAINSEWSMRQDYSGKWLPDRRTEYGKYPRSARIYIGDYVFVHPSGQLTETKTVRDVFGPQGTYGRVIGINALAEDPVDRFAIVQLGNGQKSSFYYSALEKVDRERLGYRKWQQLLGMMIGEEISDTAKRYSGGP